MSGGQQHCRPQSHQTSIVKKSIYVRGVGNIRAAKNQMRNQINEEFIENEDDIVGLK